MSESRTWVWYFLILGVLSAAAATILIVFNLRQQLKPEQLAAAKALWKAKGPRDYDMTYRQLVGDEPETFVVRVRGGQVESVERNGQPEQYSADMVVLSADPRTVPPERIADLEVRATFLAGRQVYGQ